jgi:hypothetical protein
MKVRRTVQLIEGTTEGRKSKPKLWAFDVHAVAKAAGVSSRTVRRAIIAGTLEPRSLLSLHRWLSERIKPEVDVHPHGVL